MAEDYKVHDGKKLEKKEDVKETVVQTPKEEIKKEWSNNGSLVSGLGTTLHFNIECFMNEEIEYEDGTNCHYTHEELLEVYEPIQESCIEWEYFLKFVKDFILSIIEIHLSFLRYE